MVLSGERSEKKKRKKSCFKYCKVGFHLNRNVFHFGNPSVVQHHRTGMQHLEIYEIILHTKFDPRGLCTNDYVA
jgi:hypothetical protein